MAFSAELRAPPRTVPLESRPAGPSQQSQGPALLQLPPSRLRPHHRKCKHLKLQSPALGGPAPPAPPSRAGEGAPGDQLCLQHAPGWSAVDLVRSLCLTLSRSKCWGPSCRSHLVRGPRRCVPPPPRGGTRPSGKRRAGPVPTVPTLPHRSPSALSAGPSPPETAHATPFTIATHGVHLHQVHQSFPTSSVSGALKSTPEANF